MEQEVGLEEGRLAAVALRSKCRKLENESLFADVFEQSEEEIRQLQVIKPPMQAVCCVTNDSMLEMMQVSVHSTCLHGRGCFS